MAKTIKLRGFDSTKAQRGWVCDCCYTVETANQCSREEHVARGYSSTLGVIGLLMAMWSSWQNAKFNAERIEAKPGDRETNGWLGHAVMGVLWLVAAMLTIAVTILVCTTPAHASSPCGHFFVKQQAVYAAPVYAAPVYYQAGVGIEQDALAAKVARIVVGQLRAELRAQPLPAQASASQSALAQHCSKCHSGATPKAGIVYDGATALACVQVTAALRSIASDQMPKDHKLTPEQKGAIMQELLDLEADRPQPATVPTPTPGELK